MGWGDGQYQQPAPTAPTVSQIGMPYQHQQQQQWNPQPSWVPPVGSAIQPIVAAHPLQTAVQPPSPPTPPPPTGYYAAPSAQIVSLQNSYQQQPPPAGYTPPQQVVPLANAYR
eukprot:TRINITY_DN15741_c0_g1_i1.p1 TRINITY_DN15741_c0_g1~~TRINITY_DN15741_c0_g1_i1.p1  ORF type:complete len:131 (+),score=29.53 TRINITY_DN15741_c0_g1_i1:57-395(+)